MVHPLFPRQQNQLKQTHTRSICWFTISISGYVCKICGCEGNARDVVRLIWMDDKVWFLGRPRLLRWNWWRAAMVVSLMVQRAQWDRSHGPPWLLAGRQIMVISCWALTFDEANARSHEGHVWLKKGTYCQYFQLILTKKKIFSAYESGFQHRAIEGVLCLHGWPSCKGWAAWKGLHTISYIR